MIIKKEIDGHVVEYNPMTAKEGSKLRSWARKHPDVIKSIHLKLVKANFDEEKVVLSKREQQAIRDGALKAPDELGEEKIITIDGKPWAECPDDVFMTVCQKLFGGNG